MLIWNGLHAFAATNTNSAAASQFSSSSLTFPDDPDEWFMSPHFAGSFEAFVVMLQ
jgi:hypothetical protein